MNEPALNLDEQHLAAWRGLLNAHAAAVGAIERDLEASGHIPLTWYDVLVALSEAPKERLRLHELADSVVLSRSGLTRLVDRLEGEGYLTREQTPGDRRGFYATITEQGVSALRAAWPIYSRGIQRYFAEALSPEEAETLAALLQKIADHFREQE